MRGGVERRGVPRSDSGDDEGELAKTRRARRDQEFRGGPRVDGGRVAEEEIEPIRRVGVGGRALAHERDGRPDPIERDVEAARTDKRQSALGVHAIAGQARRLEVLVIDGQELLRVELAVAFVAMLPVEGRHELFEGKDLLVTVRPTKPGEIVEDGVGRVALIAVLAHADGAVALAQLLAVGREHHREMSESRGGHLERLIKENLRGRVDHVVAAARDDGDPHLRVVDRGAKVVERHPVGSQKNEVLLRRVRRRDLAEHEVDVRNVPRVRRFEPNHMRRVGLVASTQARARVLERRLRVARLELGSLLLEVFFRAEAPVGLALPDQPLGDLSIEGEAIHLRVGSRGPPHIGPFIPREPEPAERVDDDSNAVRRAPLLVGVLDAEDEGAAGLSGPQPIEERRTDAPDVQISRRRRSKADARHGRALT